MGKIVVNFNFPDLTAEQYDRIIGETEPIRKAKFPGLLFHVAAANGKGLFVCDVWENEADFKAFGEMLLPVLKKVGGTPAPPTVLPLHNLINEL